MKPTRLPVGGGGMFSENALALLSLVAISIAGGAGAGAFAGGVGKLLGIVTFGALPPAYGTALGFGAFVVIVLTVVQLVFRVMRVTLAEWLGEIWVGLQECAHLRVRLHAADAAAGAERHLDLPVAVVRRLEPVDGGAEPADRQPVAAVGGQEPALRAVPDAVHVRHHHGGHRW